MKKSNFMILGILCILILVVAASGCTSESANNTYSANGVSFTYPGAWSEQNLTDLQKRLGSSPTLLGAVGNDTNQFYVGKVTAGSNQKLVSVTQWASSYKSAITSKGETFVSGKSITVDGVPAYQITAKIANNYATDVAMVKNNTGYLAVYVSPTNDQQTFEQILNSLKIT
jgi:PsbP-like protein